MVARRLSKLVPHIQGCLVRNPEKAHSRDAPRTSTIRGMPKAMPATLPTLAQGFFSLAPASPPPQYRVPSLVLASPALYWQPVFWPHSV
jgi:hypothetical protein